MITPARVLLVWADLEHAGAAAAALTAAGFDTRWEVDSVAGLIAVEDWQPALVVLDWHLPLINGAVFLDAVHAGLDLPPPVIALGDGHTASDATAAGAKAVLRTPIEREHLVDLVTTIFNDVARPHKHDIRVE